MGILLNKTLNNGLPVYNVYARIDIVSGSKNGLDFSLNYYATRDSFLSGKPYLQQEMYHFVPSIENDSPNFIKQAYLHLKTLEEFKNAIDIFEEGQS
ncbi:hypothetical protein DZB88_30365 [Bacillus sp. OE]|uniref:hypothetical protein n=1 Tax=Bacillus sp. OE TaxID=2293320 RepID=UPI000E2F8927|nr:hypothetical protein DZB88_30365 [Bacillus sp. OE]